MAISNNHIPPDKYKEILQLIPIVCVDVAVICDNKILLIKREQEPEKGEWWILGGRLYKGEDLEACALRKVREEANLNGELSGFLYCNSTPFDDIHTINFCYLFMTNEDTPISDGTWQEYQWIGKDHFEKIKDTFHPCIVECLQKAYRVT